MAVRKLTLPKQDENGVGLYSYSQHSKWKRDFKEYVVQYFFGRGFDGNPYTDFGDKVGESLQHNDFSNFSKREVKTLEKVTRLDEFERPIKLSFPEHGFYIRGFIDTNNEELTALIDYKTGDKNKVENYESDSYDQLAIYAAGIEEEKGWLPEYACVELILRDGNPWKGDDLTVGNDVIKIPQDITPENISKVKDNVLKGAKEVSSYYKVFQKLNKL